MKKYVLLLILISTPIYAAQRQIKGGTSDTVTVSDAEQLEFNKKYDNYLKAQKEFSDSIAKSFEEQTQENLRFQNLLKNRKDKANIKEYNISQDEHKKKLIEIGEKFKKINSILAESMPTDPSRDNSYKTHLMIIKYQETHPRN